MDVNLNKSVYFPHFDVIRFISAFMIVIVHAYEAWVGWFGQLGILTNGTYQYFSVPGGLADVFIRNFHIGVNIFFLLSGFLITYLLLKEKEANNTINLKQFYIRRVLRIWPLYFFLVAVTPLLVTFLKEPHPDYLSTALFYNNFHTIEVKTWLYPFSHFWSICIEEHFYLVWPLIILMIPGKKLIPVFVLGIAISIGFRVYTCYTNDQPWYTLYLHTLSRIDVLIVGAIGAYMYHKKPFEFKLARMSRIIIWLILIMLLCIERVEAWDSTFAAAVKNYIYIGIVSVLLLDYNFNPAFPHILKKKSIVHYFGKVSYGIYLYSNILLLGIVKLIIYMDMRNPYLFFFLVVVLSIGVPIISYELFEKRILKFKKRFEVIKTGEVD